MAGELAKKIRAKYPNAYKNMSDDELEAQMIKKYPQYGKLSHEEGEVTDKHGNIHKPDGTVVHSSFKGKERIDRRFVDTDKMRNSMINAASKTPFPRIVGALGEIPISAMELFNDPEAVAGGPLIKRGLQRINPKVIPQPTPQITPPVIKPTTSMPGSREMIPIKSEVSTLPTKAKANEIIKEAKIKESSLDLSGKAGADYTPGILKDAGVGNPGLSTTPYTSVITNKIDPNYKFISYRDTNGNPIATARIIKDADGMWMVEDFAADKTKGLLYGRAVKSVGDELKKQGIITPAGTVTPDAMNIMKKGGVIEEASEKSPRIRTSDPQTGRSIMAEIESMPKKMPQIEDVAKSPSGVGDNVESLGPIRRVFSEARALQTSLDLSAPLRQGISQIHTKEFWKNLKPMFQAARSEEGFKRLTKEIEDRPTFSLMQRAGVEFTDVSKALAKREESMRGTFVEKWIPGVRQSNRAYTLFLNKMRADTFDRMAFDVLDVIDEGVDVTKGAKAIAKFVNDATGRGSLGSWEKSAVALNDVFFSPKLIASRVNMLGRAGKATFESITRTGADDAVAKSLRKEALKSMIGYGGLGATSISLSLLNGAEGTDDPRSTDFGKLKIGNTRIDYTGGFQQYIRVAAQLASGQANIEGRIQDRNRLDVASRFLRNKLSPMVSSVVDLMAGENVIGEETNLPTEMIELVTPLIIDDLIEVIMEDPKMLPLTTPSTFFGAGSQTYGRQNSTGMPSINLDMPKMPFISQ